MKYLIEGFSLQASLILALGAQNIFVLESGLKKRRQFLVATLCSICDLLLIAVGILGAATIFIQVPLLKISFGIAGVGFLAYYGSKKIREGFKSSFSSEKGASNTGASFRETVVLSLSFSLLNPHVYLDTVILIGGYATKFIVLSERIFFGLGAGLFSILWFFSLSFFAAKMSESLSNPKTMRMISFISGVILLMLSWKLGSEVHQWF